MPADADPDADGLAGARPPDRAGIDWVLGPNRASRHASAGFRPLAALVRGIRDQVEVAAVKQNREVELLGGSGNEQAGDLAPALAALSGQTLHLKGATDVIWSRPRSRRAR